MTNPSPETRKHILFYSHTGKTSGAEQVLLNTLSTLNQEFHRPVVICPVDGDLVTQIQKLGIPTLSIGTLQARFTVSFSLLWNYLYSFCSIVICLRTATKQLQPDLIHANSVRAGLVATFATLGSSVPIIWHVQDDLPAHPLTSATRLWAYLSRKSVFIFVSSSTSRAFCGKWEFGERRCTIHNGVDTKLFPLRKSVELSLRMELGIDPGHFLLCAIGMINARKDLIGLVNAFKLVHNANSSVHLVIVGGAIFNNDELYLEKLRELTRNLELEAVVHFAGPRKDVATILRSVDLLILNACSEPFGLVLVEAMLSGTPVLATAVGGITEIITNDLSGFLTPPGDSRALALRVLQVMADPVGCKRVSQNAFLTASVRFSLPHYAAQYQKLLEEVFTSQSQAVVGMVNTRTSVSVALFHDNFAQSGGAERVAEELHRLLRATYGRADLLSTLYSKTRLSPYLRATSIRTTWMQRLPLKAKLFRVYFLLYPFAVDHAKVADYKLIVTSCFGYAKGVRRAPGALHICYCHTPMRWVWRTEDYLSRERNRSLKSLALQLPIQWLKKWELSAASRPDHYIANSSVVADRLYQAFGIHAVVIPPPIETGRFSPSTSLSSEAEDFYLVLSRLVPYKRLDLAVEACTLTNRHLIVIGDGPDRKRLQRLAGPTVKFLGRATDNVVIDHAQRCSALLFPGEEDFGMTPIEVNAAGRPVVAFRGGGAIETIVESLNGVFFDEPSASSLIKAMNRLEALPWDSAAIQRHAARYDTSVFASRMSDYIQSALQQQEESRASSALVAT